MKLSQNLMDRVAIGLSLICTIHCFATPILLALLPSLAAYNLDTEQFHLWLLFVILPISLFALGLGCKKHKRMRYLTFGAFGLMFLVLAITVGKALFGESGEKLLTLIGSILIAVGHWLNYRQCKERNNDSCDCSSQSL